MLDTPKAAAALAAYRRIAEIYAHEADRGAGNAMAALFVEDGEIVSPDATLQGRDAISRIPAMLREMFAATRHEILNQTIALHGEAAMSGETYCNALHLLHPTGEGPRQVLVWSIRYQDELKAIQGSWYLARRELVLDWKEQRPVNL
jgi:hypothetical protein